MAEAKLPKTTSFSKEDRLSNLSDDLICHILSFLPTKVAYQTSVLSTRWTSLCTKVPDLYFKFPSLRSWSEASISILSICAVLLRRTEKIRKLSLHSDHCEPCAIHMWVAKAINLGVKEIDLHLVFDRTIFLPCKLSTLESLVVLKLHGRIQPSVTSIAYLPSLKILNLEVSYWETKNVNRDFLSAFLSGCPHLEELEIRGHLPFPLEISLLFLKRLYLYLDDSPTMRPLGILNVPSIETLYIHDHSRHRYEVVNLFNVDRATLNISKPLNFCTLYKLVEGLSNVKSLCLELCTLQKYFDLNVYRTGKVRKPGWTKPTIIPTCLSTSFKVLECRGVQDLGFDLDDFKKYIIKNSAKLEKVKWSKGRKLVRHKESIFTWV